MNYQPPHPLPLPSVFNNSYFEPIDFLTITDADLRYLSKTNPVITGNLSVGGTTSSSTYRAGNGTVALPSYSFTNANDYGMWYDPTGVTSLNFSNNGSNRISITPANTQFTNTLIAPLGSVSTPSYSFTGQTNSGMYHTGGAVSLAVNGINRLLMDASNNVLLGVRLRGSDGSNSNPFYTFNTEPTMGMYKIAANQLGFCVNATEQLRLTSTGTQIGINGSVMTFHRRLAPTATITLGSNSSGNATISLGITLLNTNYDVHINIISISGPADHVTYAYDTLTTTNFRVLYKNNGSGIVGFQIQCYVSGY